MVDSRWGLALIVLVGTMSFACKKGNAPTTADATDAPSAEPPPPASPEEASDPLAQPEQALAKNADELRSLGIVLEGDDEDDRARPPPDAQPRTKSKDDLPAATRCDAICQLADTACELRTQICDLARDHVGESRYEAACWRAGDQCTRASTACEDCRGGTAGTANGSCGR